MVCAPLEGRGQKRQRNKLNRARPALNERQGLLVRKKKLKWGRGFRQRWKLSENRAGSGQEIVKSRSKLTRRKHEFEIGLAERKALKHAKVSTRDVVRNSFFHQFIHLFFPTRRYARRHIYSFLTLILLSTLIVLSIHFFLHRSFNSFLSFNHFSFLQG